MRIGVKSAKKAYEKFRDPALMSGLADSDRPLPQVDEAQSFERPDSAPPLAADELLGWRRSPAVPVAVCFAAGIASDRFLAVPWIAWLLVGVMLASCWLGRQCRRRDGQTALLLFLCWVCLGGARHHLSWSVGRADDISLFATEESKPARLLARLITQPWIRVRQEDRLRSAWPQPDSSICMIECRSLETEGRRIPVSGFARLSVTGHLLHVQVGDEVEVRGWLTRPRKPPNPGEFDFQEYLRRKGARCVIYTEHPDAVRRLRNGEDWWFQRSLARLRAEAELVFIRHLSQETIPLASALLLGDRSQMTDDIRAAFAESGTMHLLAISGLHVAILAGFLWMCCRILNLSTFTTSAVIVAVVVAYALITNARPPVVRASVMVVVAVMGLPWYRQSLLENTLAVSALIVLTWNPTDLFDIGAQLSFLAMIGIIWARSWRASARAVRSLSNLAARGSRGRWRQVLSAPWWWLKVGYSLSAAIWLVSVPLVAARFHLISPVGLLINVFLIPLVALVLWLGYALLFCGFLVPQLAGVFGLGFDAGLSFFRNLVELAAGIEMAHLYVPGPPKWWLVGYYLLIGVSISLSTSRGFRTWCWIGLTSWLLAGLIVGLLPARSSGLRCTFLAMGHGCAVLVELPNGRTLLYDAGSINDGLRATRVVQAALWERRRWQIDALVVSHADIDHFNAVPGLLRNLPVGCLCLSRQFLGSVQEPVMELSRTAATEKVPLKLIASGDRLGIDETVMLEVLHPQMQENSSEDNANSIVLLFEYAGRRILLTGDVDRRGLQQLLMQPSRKIDVLLGPHHGSKRANPPALAKWAQPDWVVVSKGRKHLSSNLGEVYGSGARVFSTADCGAVTLAIDPSGEIRASRQIDAHDRGMVSAR